jgi:hypothetical protein
MERGQSERLMEEHADVMARAGSILSIWCSVSGSLPARFTFGYLDPASFAPDVARVTAERNLPQPALRAALLAWSDIISGVSVVVIASLALTRRHAWAQMGQRRRRTVVAVCAVGVLGTERRRLRE